MLQIPLHLVVSSCFANPATVPRLSNQLSSCERHAEVKIQCFVCKEQKAVEAFSKSVIHNQADKSRTSRCIECSSPKCTNGKVCTTCPVCRDVQCTLGEACRGPMKPLHHSDSTLPKNLEELRSFKCARCAEYMQCPICEEKKPLQSFSASVVHNRSDQSRKSRCADCTNPVCTDGEACTTLWLLYSA